MTGLFAMLPAGVQLGVIAVAVGLALAAGWPSILGGVIAATWASTHGWGTSNALLVGFGAGVVVYIGDCLRDPRKKCWWCKGKKFFFNSRDFFHNCWLCGGSGQFRRLGAKVLARHRRTNEE